MQKLLIAGIDEVEPARKAKPSVTEVIVMDGPAFLIQSLSRYFVVLCKEL